MKHTDQASIISEKSPGLNELARALLPLYLDSIEDTLLQVTGWSMGSLLGPTSLVRINRLQGMPSVGEVVLLRKGNDLIAHRVISRDVHFNTILTKGDACVRADEPTHLDNIMGIVTGIMNGPQLRRPLRLSFPWALFFAWNSRMQNCVRTKYPRINARWDIFRLVYRIWERMERWIS